MTLSKIAEPLALFCEREELRYCIHAKTALKLNSDDFNVNSIPDLDVDREEFVDIL